ncbi:MAG: ABC transporter substrate-binding protein [Clostridium baratii]|uniref:Menaquinone biosynthesis family protein n=1 Tax=Clostridium baratii str. Sullivan TaxID=1415775 RepID=A0A0A7FVB8_9CLOT|nr:MqnA/MqnD/SBP family protein [Clostridium baratii]AIY82756.1 menaquinone biosynthesis family protein [Clostridium baratii str. Sullivan]MBS6005815.1 ABC transporter substrate-binding protein [Clostridium baratii]MDU1052883.1 MqnA/MqnD/SBP family protein [Clostridium baratii]MDU4912327.1 MqnA/MqnD/SBP family protein [Clostridium baratii]
MKKKIASILIVMLSVFTLIGCGTEKKVQEPAKEIKVIVPDGLPAMSAAKLINDNKEIEKGIKVNYTIEKTPETLVTDVMKGEADIAIVPSNVAATQYNKGAGYKIAATTGWGSFYLVSTEKINNIKELKGKDIYNIGKGLTPDIVTKDVLNKLGLDTNKDVTFSYLNGVTELAPTILSGKAKFAVIPEPALSQVLAKKPDLNIVMNINDEWKKLNKTEYGFPQATVIVKEDLIKNNKEFVDKFLDELKESVNFAVDNKDKIGEICSKIGVSANKDIIGKAMEKANLKYVPIKDSKNEYNTYFKKLYDFDKKSVGGKIPNEGIYMEQ